MQSNRSWPSKINAKQLYVQSLTKKREAKYFCLLPVFYACVAIVQTQPLSMIDCVHYIELMVWFGRVCVCFVILFRLLHVDIFNINDNISSRRWRSCLRIDVCAAAADSIDSMLNRCLERTKGQSQTYKWYYSCRADSEHCWVFYLLHGCVAHTNVCMHFSILSHKFVSSVRLCAVDIHSTIPNSWAKN